MQVILPQATKIAIPNIGSMFIGMVKDTSTFTIIGLVEVVRVTQNINSVTFQPFVLYTARPVIYVVAAFAIDFLFRGDREDAATPPSGRVASARPAAPAVELVVREVKARRKADNARDVDTTTGHGPRSGRSNGDKKEGTMRQGFRRRGPRRRARRAVAVVVARRPGRRRRTLQPEEAGDAHCRDDAAVQAADVPQRRGKPAGYDVMLLKALAKQMGVKLDIQNLDFNGLIPGLVAKKFDMVSVGLSATPERQKSISFSRAVRAVRPDPRGREGRHDARDDRGVEQLGQDDHLAPGLDRRAARAEDVPERDVELVPGSERSVPRGRDRPANGIVVENYLLAQFNKSNNNELKEVAFPKPLHVEYGSYAVQKGNSRSRSTSASTSARSRRAGDGQGLPGHDRCSIAADAALQVTRPTRSGRRLSPAAALVSPRWVHRR